MAKGADIGGELLKRVRAQLGMLSVQFLLGMAVNLLGEPEGGLAKAAKGILLLLHVVVAVGLIVNASLTMRAALKLGGKILRTARVATAGVGIAVVGGILTMTGPGNDWWSYVMAIGFLLAFAYNGFLYMQVLLASRHD